LLAVIAMLFLMVGCARIDHGTVVSKDFVPAHDTQEMYMIDDVPIWQTEHHPDAWYITFGLKCEDEKYRTRTIWVTKEDHDRFKAGDWINLK